MLKSLLTAVTSGHSGPPPGFESTGSGGFDSTQPAPSEHSEIHRIAGFEETRPIDWEEQILTPDYEEVIAALASGEHAPHAYTDNGHIHRKRVLVVDDNLADRLYLRAKLALLSGVDVYEASSGDEAVHMAEHTQFDGILLDVNMPGRDGYDACRTIKRGTRSLGLKCPKIYMVTSRSGLFERMRATLAGADAFLSKPPHPGDLALLLEAL